MGCLRQLADGLLDFFKLAFSDADSCVVRNEINDVE